MLSPFAPRPAPRKPEQTPPEFCLLGLFLLSPQSFVHMSSCVEWAVSICPGRIASPFVGIEAESVPLRCKIAGRIQGLDGAI
jgi:hypothetical protein